MRLLRRGRTLCNPRSPDRSHNTERELSLGSTHAGRHAFSFTVLRRRFPVEFLKHAIELRERLKPHCKRDFTDAQITVSQEITRVLEPSVRDVVDKLYAGYLFEILAQIIRVHVDHFCDSGQGELFACVFVDILARFPNRDWLSSIPRSGAFDFSSIFIILLQPLNRRRISSTALLLAISNLILSLGKNAGFRPKQVLHSETQLRLSG
jgi:hypothetical protein